MIRLSSVSRALVALALALLLAAGGMVRPVPERHDAPAEAAALALFLAAGGSLSDLCLDAGGGHGGVHRGECPDCILPAAILSPAGPVFAPHRAARPARLARAPRAQLAAPSRGTALPPPTGPPDPSFS